MKKLMGLTIGLTMTATALAETALVCRTAENSKTQIEVMVTGEADSMMMKVNHPLAGVMNQEASASRIVSTKIGGGSMYRSDLGSLSVNMTTAPAKDGTRVGTFVLKSLNQTSKLNCKREEVVIQEEETEQKGIAGKVNLYKLQYEPDVLLVSISGAAAKELYDSITTEAISLMSIPEKSVNQKIGDNMTCTASKDKMKKGAKTEITCEIMLRKGKALDGAAG